MNQSDLALVRDVATSLKLLNEDGSLPQLDSLEMMEMVAALEKSLKIRIPTAALRPQVFSTIESLAKMLTNLRENARG